MTSGKHRPLLPHVRRGGRQKEKERQKEGKTGKKSLLPTCSDTIATAAHTKASSLHVIEAHHAFHIASSTLLKLPHH